MMLEHLGKQETAVKIRRAVDEVLRQGTALTPDLGGTAGTKEYTEEIIRQL